MESSATFKYVRTGPRKLRLVADHVRGRKVQTAIDILKFSTKRAALDLGKLIRSAVSNANQKGGGRVESLYVKKIYVNQGPILKRFMPRAKGSASPIQKKMSHVTVVLEEKI